MPRCQKHPTSQVTAWGKTTSKKGVLRRYRCKPLDGDSHTFTALTEADLEAQQVARWSVPPPCPAHPESYVVRNGLYGTAGQRRRQRYRCYPDPTDKTIRHTFTPPLPRNHVHENEEHCDECEELRGIHRGETAGARRHTWSTRIVAVGLERLSRGESYADVSRWALRVTGMKRTRKLSAEAQQAKEAADKKGAKGKAKRQMSAAATEGRNAWHIAADWTEAFAPAIYDPLDAKLRQQALTAGTHPKVLLVDDMPVYGQELDPRARKGRVRRDSGFYVLVAAEVLHDTGTPTTKLRLARAMAKSNTPAWRMVFDELDYTPDFIVADSGSGILAAIDKHFDKSATTFVPSLWHLANRVETALADTAGAFRTTTRGTELIPPLRDHVAQLSRTSGALDTATTWATWWDDLEDLLVAYGLPLDKMRTQRKRSEQLMADAIPKLATNPDIPISTGGLETLISKHIEPVISSRRRGAFANLERTNRLLDLAIARHHGAFDDIVDVIAALRDDTTPNGGWTVPLRDIADARPPQGSYSSLRDATLLADLARQRGLQ